MNRLSQFALFLLALCVVAFAPAAVDYCVENSRWRLVQKLTEELQKLNESFLAYIDAMRPFSAPEELEKAKKNQKRFHNLLDSVSKMTSSHRELEEELRKTLLEDGRLSYILTHLKRAAVGSYLNAGFLFSTIVGLVVLFRLNSRIRKKITNERKTWDDMRKKEAKEATDREWELKMKIAELNGVMQKLTSASITLKPAQVKPVIAQRTPLKEEEFPAAEPIIGEQIKSKKWQFFLVFNDTERGKRMPFKKGKFVGALDAILKKELVKVNPKTLHRKLQWVSRLSPADRAISMEKISKGGKIFQGWYKMNLGSLSNFIKIRQ